MAETTGDVEKGVEAEALMEQKLYDKDGDEVEGGTELINFRGDAYTFDRVWKGKLLVTDSGGGQREFYPTVFPGYSVR